MPSPDIYLTQGAKVAYEIPVATLRAELLEVEVVKPAGFRVSILGTDEYWHDVASFDGRVVTCTDGYKEVVL